MSDPNDFIAGIVNAVEHFGPADIITYQPLHGLGGSADDHYNLALRAMPWTEGTKRAAWQWLVLAMTCNPTDRK